MADLLETVRSGGRLWPWQWARLARRDDAPTIAALLARAAEGAMPAELLRTLVTISGRTLGALRLATDCAGVTVLAGCLATEAASGGVHMLGQLWRFDHYLTLFRNLGEAALEPLRRLLDGAPREAALLSSNDGWWSNWFGPKIVALQVVGAARDESDRARFERLADDPREPAAVREAAALLADTLAEPAAARAALAEALLAVPGDAINALGEDHYYGLLGRLAAAGPALIEPAVTCLVGDDWVLRKRAAELLWLIGEPCREAVTELRRTTTDWRVEQAIEQILTTINWRLARLRRGPSDRSLSRAARRPAVGARSLSEAEKGDERGT